MGETDALLFSELLFAYKHLWIKYQEFKYLTEHPDGDQEQSHQQLFDLADEVFQPLADALLAGHPLRDDLRKLLRATEHPGVK